MVTLSQIENIDYIKEFQRNLRKKNYNHSTEILEQAAKFYKNIITYFSRNDIIKTQNELISIIRELGKSFINIDPLQFSIGNITKRILHCIREEFKNKKESSKEDLEFDENILTEKYKNSTTRLSTNKISKILDKEDKYNLPITQDNWNNILISLKEIIEEIEISREELQLQSLVDEYINDGDIILTANYSEQLVDCFIECHKQNKKKFKVFVTESAPSLNGIKSAKKLKECGINATVIDDSALFSIIQQITKVFIGTRAIMMNGGLISYNGVYNVCLCAKKFCIPVIVIGGTFKLTPNFCFGHEIFNEYSSPDYILGKDVKYEGDINNIIFNTPEYDYVPPELITVYLTDNGIQNPVYIYRLFSELYSKEDYVI